MDLTNFQKVISFYKLIGFHKLTPQKCLIE